MSSFTLSWIQNQGMFCLYALQANKRSSLIFRMTKTKIWMDIRHWLSKRRKNRHVRGCKSANKKRRENVKQLTFSFERCSSRHLPSSWGRPTRRIQRYVVGSDPPVLKPWRQLCRLQRPWCRLFRSRSEIHSILSVSIVDFPGTRARFHQANHVHIPAMICVSTAYWLL